MKIINQKNKFLFLGILLALSSCHTDDNYYMGKIRTPLFPETALEIIHSGSQKSWKITNYINVNHNPNYSLEIEVSCLIDDVYTFKNDNINVDIDLGESKCLGKILMAYLQLI